MMGLFELECNGRRVMFNANQIIKITEKDDGVEVHDVNHFVFLPGVKYVDAARALVAASACFYNKENGYSKPFSWTPIRIIQRPEGGR